MDIKIGYHKLWKANQLLHPTKYNNKDSIHQLSRRNVTFFPDKKNKKKKKPLDSIRQSFACFKYMPRTLYQMSINVIIGIRKPYSPNKSHHG